MSSILRNRFLAELARSIGDDLAVDRPSSRPVPVRDGEGEFLKRARRAVENGLDRPDFGVTDLAIELDLSPRQLRRRILAEAGTSPVRFIRCIRLERARSLIEDGQQTVSIAAQSVNISSLSYFAKCFREEFGLNPSDFPARSTS